MEALRMKEIYLKETINACESFFNPHPRIGLLIYRERKGEKKIERWERDTLISHLLCAPPPVIKPATQVCALTGNPRYNFLCVCVCVCVA